MGFRTGGFAKVWDVKQVSDKVTKLQLSCSKKNREGQYETVFGDWVSVLGTSAASKARTLQRGDTIKIGDCDVENNYDKDKKQKFYSFKMFSFEQESADQSTKKADATKSKEPAAPDATEEDGGKLPW